MQLQFLKRVGNKELILFFTGWAHCPNTLSQINTNNFDVLVAFDYRSKEISQNLQNIISNYQKVHLLAWSFGVFVANNVLQHTKLHSATALNGTINPISNTKGIPEKVFNLTLKTLNPENLEKFITRMCYDEQTIEYYQKCKPKREFSEQNQELLFLQQWVNNNTSTHNIFKKTYISLNDTIFPTTNQKNSWEELLPKKHIFFMKASHFPFTLQSNILDILDL